MQEVSANTQQLNQAARLATTRNMNFEDALSAVMQDPSAAATLERNNASPDMSAVLEAFSRGSLAGRASLEAEQRQAGYEKRMNDVENLALEVSEQIEQLRAGSVGLALGFSDHLRQHSEIQAGQRTDFDVEKTAKLVLEGMTGAGMSDQQKANYLASLTDLPKPKAKALMEDNKRGSKTKSQVETQDEK
jgi:hypothetical protein